MKTIYKKIRTLMFAFSLILLVQNSTFTQEKFPVLKGQYLGQKPPGKTSEIFAPGIISTKNLNERDLTFSPDGKEMYFTQWGGQQPWKTTVMKLEKNVWTKPETVSFSGQYTDAEAFFTPDGQQMFFISDRPIEGNQRNQSMEIWYVEREGTDWGTPKILGPPFEGGYYTTFTQDWIMYLTLNRDIHRAEYINGKFGNPQRLGDNVNTPLGEGNSFIAPDESYLIFTGWGKGDSFGEFDLYISFRQENGTWSESVNMGKEVNSDARDYCPYVSYDGKYLFYTSRKSGTEDIYWVDAKIIEKLVPDELK